MASTAILFSDDIRLHQVIAHVLGGHCWTVTVAHTVTPALAADVAVVILDGAAHGAIDRLERIRAAAAPASGVPVLQHGGARLPGVSALLPPLDDTAAVAAAIAVFTGAPGDHALRRRPFLPFYRLVRLLGMPAAAATFGRFAEALHDASVDPAAHPDPEQAHRLAGLAGAIGFTALSHAWREAARGDADRIAYARALTHKTLEEIETGDSARYR